ncbi:MAG: pyroglutamyl-peptidase I [Clostridia bacterium]|nr:pyroglutamyl-peptidase I [Clostridia bacterium]
MAEGRIVVTGFEPFGGASVNASWEAVRTLDGVEKALLPVSFARTDEAIRQIAASAPDAVICVGEAGGRSAISVERVAVNLMDARIPDNDGARPVDVPIEPTGPAARFATLPTRRIVECIRKAGLPAELSYSAGTYVCNATFYALMEALVAAGTPALGGFIHVPASGMAAGDIARGLDVAVRCVREALEGR